MNYRGTRFLTRAIAIGAVASVGILGLSACGNEAGGGSDGEGSSFPEGDITFVVQAAAGGASDLTSRALAAELENDLGVSIVVENRPGASGSIAFEYVRDQDPDGYTIGFAPVEFGILQHVGYDIDPVDFTFLGQIMNSPVVLAVPADSPYDTFEDFLEAAESGEVSVANSGTATSFAAATTALADETNANLNPVPFDGGAPAVAAAIGGQVDAVMAGAGETAQPFADGTLKVLTIFADEEHPNLEGVPTAQSLDVNLQFGAWGGVYGPAGLPDDVLDVLVPAIEKAASSEAFVAAITPSGSLPTYRTPAEFTEFIDEESVRFGELLG